MKTRKFVVPSKPMLSNEGERRPRERRTLGLRYGGSGEGQGSEAAR